MGNVTSLLSLLAMAAAQTSGPSQGGPPPDGSAIDRPHTVDPVVIEARRRTERQRREAASAFARDLAAPTKRGYLARWEGRLCIGVAGQPRKQAAYIVDRIAAEAQTVGLEVGRPGCVPNMLILFNSRPEAVAEEFRRKQPEFFAHKRPTGAAVEGGAGQDLRAFLTTPRAVRWWHVVGLTASDGRPLSVEEVVDGSFHASMVNRTTGATRLSALWRENILRGLIIIDTTRTQGVDYESLASYLAMVSLGSKPNHGLDARWQIMIPTL